MILSDRYTRGFHPWTLLLAPPPNLEFSIMEGGAVAIWVSAGRDLVWYVANTEPHLTVKQGVFCIINMCHHWGIQIKCLRLDQSATFSGRDLEYATSSAETRRCHSVTICTRELLSIGTCPDVQVFQWTKHICRPLCWTGNGVFLVGFYVRVQ